MSEPTRKEQRAAAREEARRVRLEAQRRKRRARRVRLTATGVVVALVAALAGYLWIRDRSGRDQEIEAARSEAACSKIAEHAEEGHEHVQSSQKVAYKTTPPSSGDHYGSPANWGVYRSRVEDETLVHNLEHGGVVVHYSDKLTEAEIEDLEELVDGYPDPGPPGGTGVILNPNPEVESGVALASWTFTQTCEKPLVAAVRAFIDERCGHGREPFRLGCD